ncbi:MAG: Lrp/AsnC family transcriptional regulator [Clostridia bacterium]|nr:Lrp/AsnC family transcriptional regulator [Clostridia bacterium]
MQKILEILEKDCQVTPEQIAVMLNRDLDEVREKIQALRDNGIIVGSKLLIDWDQADSERVTAFIELRCTPQHGEGFDNIARRIYQYEHVKTVWLMSGSFDIGLIIEGKTMKEVALFVAEKLAPMDAVVSTGTHFVLKTYKDSGIIYQKPQKDERSIITL